MEAITVSLVSLLGKQAFGVLAKKAMDGVTVRLNKLAAAEKKVAEATRLKKDLQARLSAIAPQVETIVMAAASTADRSLVAAIDLAALFLDDLQSALQTIGDAEEDALIARLSQLNVRADALVPYLSMALSSMAASRPLALANGTSVSASILLRASRTVAASRIRALDGTLPGINTVVVAKMTVRLYNVFASAARQSTARPESWQLHSTSCAVEIRRGELNGPPTSHAYTVVCTPSEVHDATKGEFAFSCRDICIVYKSLSGSILALEDEASSPVIVVGIAANSGRTMTASASAHTTPQKSAQVGGARGAVDGATVASRLPGTPIRSQPGTPVWSNRNTPRKGTVDDVESASGCYYIALEAVGSDALGADERLDGDKGGDSSDESDGSPHDDAVTASRRSTSDSPRTRRRKNGELEGAVVSRSAAFEHTLRLCCLEAVERRDHESASDAAITAFFENGPIPTVAVADSVRVSLEALAIA